VPWRPCRRIAVFRNGVPLVGLLSGPLRHPRLWGVLGAFLLGHGCSGGAPSAVPRRCPYRSICAWFSRKIKEARASLARVESAVPR
jgi:hypothetical protein